MTILVFHVMLQNHVIILGSRDFMVKSHLKSDSHLPKKVFLFASKIAFQKLWKMLFISS